MLTDLLEEKRQDILHRWIEMILDTYPQDASGFLHQERDRFSNPIGHTIRKETEVLYSALLGQADSTMLAVSLDRIVRLRTVQDLSPAQAVSFVYLLKTVIREELCESLKDPKLVVELLDFESSIDGLALQAFDNYMGCKQAIYDIRAREAHRRTEKLVEQVNRIYDQRLGADDDSEQEDNSKQVQ